MLQAALFYYQGDGWRSIFLLQQSNNNSKLQIIQVWINPVKTRFSKSQPLLVRQFQSLFSKESLRKNLYIYQHLNSDMILRTKVIYQQRKVAAITKDTTIILNCLKRCPLVQVIDAETIRLLVTGDALITKIYGNELKNTSQAQIKKMVTPLLKDIKHQIKPSSSDEKLTVLFNSETSVAEFIERVKSKNLPIRWELEQKDPYQCIKKSISYLLKERKNQGSQETHYNFNNSYYQQNYYSPTYPTYTNYDASYYTYQQAPYKYQIFIRKAVSSQDEQTEQPQKSKANLKIQQQKKVQHKMEEKQVPSKFTGDDFPQL